MGINFGKSKINYKKLSLDARNFLVAKGFLFLVFISVMLLVYCGYLWYTFVAYPQWSKNRKQEYINTKEKEVIFDQKKFEAVINEIKVRKNEYDSKIENVPDTFRLK